MVRERLFTVSDKLRLVTSKSSLELDEELSLRNISPLPVRSQSVDIRSNEFIIFKMCQIDRLC